MTDIPPGLNIEKIRKVLIDRQTDLKSMSESAELSRAPVELDQQSVGRLSRQDALQQQAMAKAQETRRQQELLRIDDALHRLEESEYGWCAECGEAIATQRLTIDPLAQLCVACAQ